MDPRTLGLSEEDLAKLGYEVRRAEKPRRAEGAVAEPAGPGSHRPGSSSGGGRPGSGLGRWLWTAGLFLAAAWGASSARQTISPVPANRPDSVFSSGRAMAQLVEVARAPRPPASPEHARVAQYLRARLEALGLEAGEAGGTVALVSDGTADVVTVRHVMGRLRGTASSGAILLMVGYDTAPGSQGAGDDGIGIASLLETARVLTSGGPLRNDVVVLFADGTTMGNPGFASMVSGHEWLRDVSVVLRLDALGVSGPVWGIPSRTGQGGLASLAARVLPGPQMASVTSEVPAPPGSALSVGDEPLPGTPTMTFTAIGGYGLHGTALDRAEQVSEGTLAHEGTQLVALVRHLGGLEPEEAVRADSAPRVWMSLPALGVVEYPVSSVLPTSVLLALAWLGLLASLRATKGRVRMAFVAAGLSVVAAIAVAGAGAGILDVIRRTHPELGRAPGGIWDAGPFVAAVAASAMTVLTAVVALARTRLSAGELQTGALLIPVAFTAWLSVTHTGAAPGAQLATAAALASAMLFMWIPRRMEGGRPAWVVGMLLTAVVLFALMPSLEWVATVRGVDDLVVTGALLGVAALLFAPWAEWLRAPRVWLAPVAGVVSVATLVAWGNYRAFRPESHPIPTSLALLVEDSTLVTPVQTPGPDSVPARARSVEGTWLTVPGAGEAWARSWAVPGRVPREPGDLVLPDGPAWVAAGAGPAAPLGAMTVLAQTLSAEDGAGLVRLQVRPGLNGEMMGLVVPDGSPVAVHAVDDVVLQGDDVRRVRRWGRSPEEPVAFDLRVPSAGAFEVDVVEHHLRPRPLLGGGFFERDRTVVPDVSTGGDRVIQRLRVIVSGK